MVEAHHRFCLLMLCCSCFVRRLSVVVFLFSFVFALYFFTFDFWCFDVALFAYNAAALVSVLLCGSLEVLAIPPRLPAKSVSLKYLYTIYSRYTLMHSACYWGTQFCLFGLWQLLLAVRRLGHICHTFTYYCNFHALNNVTVACARTQHTRLHASACICPKHCASGRIRNQWKCSHFSASKRDTNANNTFITICFRFMFLLQATACPPFVQ